MEPLSITAAAIGITTFAKTSIKDLKSLIDGLSDAQNVISDISSALFGIEGPLTALEQLSISDESTSAAAKRDLQQAGVAEAVNKCGDVCKEFSKQLEKWTKHSSETKLSLRDRLSVGVWNKEKIRKLRAQLQSCEATVQFAVTNTQLMVQLRGDKASEVERENVHKQLLALETTIQEHIGLTKEQQGNALLRMQELQGEQEGGGDDEAERILALKEVEEQSRILEADQVSSGVIFSQAHSLRSGQDIRDVFTSDNSQAMVGLPESVVGKINQRIENVRTEGGSKAVVGVWSGDFSFK